MSAQRMSLALLCCLLGGSLFCGTSQAQQVTTTADSGPGSLRQAIADAAPGAVVTFSGALAGQTITLGVNAPLVIDKELTIDGGALAVSVSGGHHSRVLEVRLGASVALIGLTIRDGHAPDGTPGSEGECGENMVPPGDGGPGEDGGGIYNGGTLTLTAVQVLGSQAGDGGPGGFVGFHPEGGDCPWPSGIGGTGGHGGGIYNTGTLNLYGTGLLGNRAGNGGSEGTWGGCCQDYGLPGGDGGGLYNFGGLVNVDQSIIAENTSGAGGHVADVQGLGGSGGGIYTTGEMTMTRSEIRDNATAGGFNGAGNGGGIYNVGELTIRTSAITSNEAPGNCCAQSGDHGGGGIYNGGDLTIEASTIQDNFADNAEGGGIRSFGPLTLLSSTVSGNIGAGGSGLYGGAITVVGSTITDNPGAGVEVLPGGEVLLKNTIVAGNLWPEGSGFDCAGSGFTSLGYNLFGEDTGCPTDDPTDRFVDPAVVSSTVLGPLADNGGPTHTHALLPASPALDAASCSDHEGSPVLTDQRGEPRLSDDPSIPNAGAGCDIGAFELQVPELPPVACADAVVRIAAFDADQGASDTREWVRISHDEAAPVDFTGCHLAAVLGRTDRSTFTTPLSGIVAPGGTLLVGNAAVAEVDVVIPNNTLHDARSAIYVLKAPMPPGTRPVAVAGSLLAGVTYLSESQWYSQFPAPLVATKQGTGQATTVEGLIASLAEMGQEEEVPAEYALSQNYPNPFNPQTTIRFALPEAGQVELVVYDVLGRAVRRLVSQPLEAGVHTVRWDGRDAAGAMAASGAYVYRMEAGSFRETRRMVLVR